MRFIGKHIDDILALVGVGLVVYATWMISVIAAFYVAGGFCLGAAVLIGFSRSKK